ncbi:unnamed protein product [Rotaria magnacalcarata]|uniref:DUF962 domain-containing protein n=1 Tax=Rotaria magnacalcarata TaxID=392030 RepID=A0A814USV3_9BILA|nr:unnamed protein product [Rotaria magnacalcarata]CAF1680652.1 unnamed protein product [Rotaria magnacalcarata]CAF1937978.1 unnamed protein product [Rotaria magnacalcarata]CAF2062151.1 unnamed protein product [Rotaria magnacalcarata]CAF2102666.1 unnamed protein product [Rotaria magnacalcarata]
MPGKELTAWLDEYGFSHQNPINILIHKICVPTITVTLLAMLWCLPIIPKTIRNTISIGQVGLLNPSLILVPVFAFYWNLSSPMAIAMAVLFVIVMSFLVFLEKNNVRIFRLALIVFILAWIGQFVGHEIEGKKPAFFKDLQFLLIGPLWTLAHAFRYFGIDY